jgi:hypothetical protein
MAHPGLWGRFAFPGVGIVQAFADRAAAPTILPWVVVGAAFVAGAAVLARHDALTWIALAFVCLAAALGTDVWALKLGFVRTLIPMFVFGGIACAGGLRAHTARRIGRADAPDASPALSAPQ